MSIVTKTGDRAVTRLLGKASCFKDDPRLEACGTVDELSAFIGFSRSLIRHKKTRSLLESFQNDLFLVGSQLACADGERLARTLGSRQVARLEALIRELEQERGAASGFIVAGSDQVSASLHLARTVCRRLERRVVTVCRRRRYFSRQILVYLNRLSDILYLLAERAASEVR